MWARNATEWGLVYKGIEITKLNELNCLKERTKDYKNSETTKNIKCPKELEDNDKKQMTFCCIAITNIRANWRATGEHFKQVILQKDCFNMIKL